MCSSDLWAVTKLIEDDGRAPSASINFVTAHDGFTLRDLVSYNEKHNEANGEGNRDGESHNRSWNMGVEGPTSDPEILELRDRQRRNFLATIFLSQGIPMLLGGDELGRTQGGNNNGYCQDSEISWFDWEETDVELLAFTQRLIAFRRAHPVFRRRHFFHGEPLSKDELPDIAWIRPDGKQMSPDDWHGDSKAIGVFLNGQAIGSPDLRGERVEDDSFLVVLNAHHDDATFMLPKRLGRRWLRVIDTADAFEEGQTAESGKKTSVTARSLAVFRRTG